MDFESKYNTKIPAVKRLMREACELHEPTEDYSAAPLQENLFEWHFTVKGADATEFEGGVYHGRIVFPNEYPMKPPNIILLTPNGRFEVNKKICLSISGHHPETWQPSWSIRTALLALIAFMPSEAKGTIASLDYTPQERKTLARKSQQWKCPECGPIVELLGKNISNISQAESQMIKSVTFKPEVQPAKSSPSQETRDPHEASTEPTSLSTPSTTPGAPPFSASNTTPGATPFSAPNTTPGPTPFSAPNATPDPPLTHSAFFFEQTTADCLIVLIVLALSFLIYRRFF